MTKNELRKQISVLRDNLSVDEIQKRSSEIFNNLLKIQTFDKCDTILCYVNIKSEADTCRIIKYYQERHKKTAAPKVIGKFMDFFYFKDYSQLSDNNRFQIPEPINTDKCIPDENSLIIMPGLIFDESGSRIGYGGGYYDKYLEKYKKPAKIAIAYDFQVIEHIDKKLMEDTDIKPDYIVTDKRILKIS